MINTAPGDEGPTSNNLEYAIDLDEGGHEVEVYFDGEGTQWIPELENDPETSVVDYYEQAREQDLVAGACGFCANAFDVTDEIEQAGIEIRGGPDEHGPDVAQLAAEEYQFINVG